MEFVQHIPVLADTVTRLFAAGTLLVDATVGTGGHTVRLLESGGPERSVIGIDRDPKALQVASRRLSAYGERVHLVCGNFRRITALLDGRTCDGILLDLGVSSLQIADPHRGFSYLADGPLDMSMGSDGRPVIDLLASASEREIAQVLKMFGEERRSRAIARAIVRARERREITTSAELRHVVEHAVPARGLISTLARVFQSLRIWANEELESLKEFLPQAVESLNTGGCLVVISYHSLEDRVVKNFFRREEKGCICPSDIPTCRCGRQATLKILTRRPQRPTSVEVEGNPRARSAKLRAAERI
jgi:16S rRNA (cytosine1402-N4)-methyltransferase